MRGISFFLFLWLLSFSAPAQTDSGRVADTTGHFKEAPESFKKLIEEVTAQEEAKSKETDIEIDGLLFDETKTKIGGDFYNYFYTGWQAPPDAKNYAIFISEKPYRLMTTLI